MHEGNETGQCGVGERILILRAEWLELILNGTKTLEIIKAMMDVTLSG